MGKKVLLLVEKFPWIQRMYMEFLSLETSASILQEKVKNKILDKMLRKCSILLLGVFSFLPLI